jgi:murein DD-endopeptidase MepM/ murein hydrolase activator NlpD
MEPILLMGLIAGGLSVIVAVVSIVVKLTKKPKSNRRVVVGPDYNTMPEDESHPQILVEAPGHKDYERFISMYDSGNLEFNNTEFRRGAPVTCDFGISNGFKYINGKMEWGYVRLHTGVDRARGNTYTFKNGDTIEDPVISPFHFNRSAITDYGNTGYGTLIQLFNDEFGFEMRIAHMDPDKDILPWALNRLKNCQGFKAGWLLGSAGTCGDSTGPHTHTEFISLKETCPVFDEILENKFGKKALTEYSKTEVLKEYRKHKHFINATDEEILKDWINVKAYRGAYFVNKYKYKYIVNGVKRTRYASNLLFNGL